MAALPPLALRLSGQDHALEIGRDYLLGSAADCDLTVHGAVAGHHVRVRVSAEALVLEDLSGGNTRHNGIAVDRAELRAGDVLELGDQTLMLVLDHGSALMVPLPGLRIAAATRRVRHAAAALVRSRESESFHELMADELRRAPWFGASLILHALLLLVLWLLVPNRAPGSDGPKTVAVELTGADTVAEPPPPPPEVVTEVAPVDFTPVPDLDPEPADDAPPPAADSPPDAGLRSNPRLATRSGTGGTGGGTGDSDGVLAAGSGDFRRQVDELRRSGLEIVFVFDSTGSMSRTILDTKNSIAQMLTVLRALVPDARVGIVTFRDRHRSEQYLVRQVPLGGDFWRASNFMHVVTAEGGGDRPEDVRAGLRAAFTQRWQPNARRVVVLAGDAPPHEADLSSLLGDVRAFARNGQSFVHTVVTSPDTADAATRSAFAGIATTGKGTCTDLAAHDRVLQRVLTLAFGREFERDLAAVVAAAQQASERVDVQALDLAHRGGPDLRRALLADPVPATVLQALVRRPRRAVALELVDLLAARSTPERTRHAAAWVLRQQLSLATPPVDPETGAAANGPVLSTLRVRCASLPD